MESDTSHVVNGDDYYPYSVMDALVTGYRSHLAGAT